MNALVLASDVLPNLCTAAATGKLSRYDLPIFLDVIEQLCMREDLRASYDSIERTIPTCAALVASAEGLVVPMRCFTYLGNVCARHPQGLAYIDEPAIAPQLVKYLRFACSEFKSL